MQLVSACLWSGVCVCKWGSVVCCNSQIGRRRQRKMRNDCSSHYKPQLNNGGSWCIYGTRLDLKLVLTECERQLTILQNNNASKFPAKRERTDPGAIQCRSKTATARRRLSTWLRTRRSFLDRARLQISTNIKKLPPGHTKTMQPESGGPQARQGRIYKPTIRSKLNPKRSYNSTGAFWWASHPMLLLVASQRINRPGNHITVCWLSSLGECTRQMMWGRSHCDTGVAREMEGGGHVLEGSERITMFTFVSCFRVDCSHQRSYRLGLFFIFLKSRESGSNFCMRVYVHKDPGKESVFKVTLLKVSN